MGVLNIMARGLVVGLWLSVLLWLVLTQVDLRARLDRQHDRAEALADQVAELESDLGAREAEVLSLETQVEVLSDQLAEATPRIGQGPSALACAEAIAGGPALPADWTYGCEAESPDDDALGIAIPERWLGNDQWSGTIEVYYDEHLEFGPVGSDEFQAELVDTVYHEAHHAWCLRSGGTVDHTGDFDQVPVCSVAVPVGPPVGDWGGGDG